IDLIYQAASIVVPSLLLPLLLSFTRRARRFAHVIVPIIVITALASMLSLLLSRGEPMIIGLGVSVVLHSLQAFRREPPVIE
ncbi:MAG: hypothetical protein NTX15_06405, partial [Candidatus Kapabacteria bacterium]|nr:hypothetical protein [Candidatus Kapabacteria bacterium]